MVNDFQHYTKCEVIQITLKIPYNQLIIYIIGHQLKQVTKAKYLGVTLDSKLNFNKHTDVVCKQILCYPLYGEICILN